MFDRHDVVELGAGCTQDARQGLAGRIGDKVEIRVDAEPFDRHGSHIASVRVVDKLLAEPRTTQAFGTNSDFPSPFDSPPWRFLQHLLTTAQMAAERISPDAGAI